MAEVQDRRLVRQRARQPQTCEPPHRLDLVQHVLHTRVTQVVEQLHAVYPQHRRQLIGPAAPARLGIVRPDALFQLFPWDQTIHALQEYLPASLALLAVVFQVRKCWLVHRILHPRTSLSDYIWHVTMPQPADLFRVSLRVDPALEILDHRLLGGALRARMGRSMAFSAMMRSTSGLSAKSRCVRSRTPRSHHQSPRRECCRLPSKPWHILTRLVA